MLCCPASLSEMLALLVCLGHFSFFLQVLLNSVIGNVSATATTEKNAVMWTNSSTFYTRWFGKLKMFNCSTTWTAVLIKLQGGAAWCRCVNAAQAAPAFTFPYLADWGQLSAAVGQLRTKSRQRFEWEALQPIPLTSQTRKFLQDAVLPECTASACNSHPRLLVL